MNSTSAHHGEAAVPAMRGGKFERAVDKLYVAEKPRDTAQEILNHLPNYAV